MEKNNYPHYYRRHGKCIKVVSPTECKTIILPPDRQLPERFSSTYPTPERLKEALAGFELTNAVTWRSFFFTFAQLVAAERDEANKFAVVEDETKS